MARTSYELDEAAIFLIAEKFQQMKAAEVGIGTVLAYFARQNGIVGDIRLSADRRTIEVMRAPGEPMPGEDSLGNPLFQAVGTPKQPAGSIDR